MTLSIEQAREIVNFQISYGRTYTGKDLELFDKAMDPPTRAYAQGMVEGWDAAVKKCSEVTEGWKIRMKKDPHDTVMGDIATLIQCHILALSSPPSEERKSKEERKA